MSEKLNNIYHPSNCLSQQQLFDYIDNKLNHQQKRLVEHHLLDCELCSDALEGLSMLKNREIAFTATQQLQAEFIPVDIKVIPLNWFERNYKFMAAASILLLIGFGFYFFQIVSTKETQVAEVVTKSTNSEIEKSVQPITSTKETANKVLTEKQATPPTPPTIVKRNIENERPAATGEKTLKPSDKAPVAVSESAPEATGPSQLADKIIQAEADQEEEFAKSGGIARNSTADDAYKKEEFANSKSKTLREEDSEKSREAKKTSNVDVNKKDKTISTASEERAIPNTPAAEIQNAAPTDLAITAPTYPGGEKAMQAFILKNKKACEACSAKVKVNFIVEANGNLSNIEVKEQTTACACAITEAKRLVASMPKWNPGESRGTKQASLWYIIITF